MCSKMRHFSEKNYDVISVTDEDRHNSMFEMEGKDTQKRKRIEKGKDTQRLHCFLAKSLQIMLSFPILVFLRSISPYLTSK